jgi:predicted esterase/Tfp pilus assembly protein PilF
MRAVALLLLVGAFQDAELRKEFDSRRAALKECREAGPWSELGRWALEKELTEQARTAFQEALKIDPSHAEAREGMRRLGWEEEGGKWLPFAKIFAARKAKVKPGDKAALLALAAWCGAREMAKERRQCLDAALKIDPDDAAANEALGRRLHEGRWIEAEEFEREVKVEGILRAGLGTKSAAELAEEIRKAAGGWKGDLAAIVERAKSPGPGTYKDQKLEVERDKYPGVYHYGIPDDYAPWRRSPMIVFLHGSGGNTYFPTISKWTLKRGFIVVCPSSLHLGTLAWSNGQHVGYIRALVKEMQGRYAVDASRIYLWGHSMGGYGTFFIGTRTTDLFAAISPMSGGPSGWKPEALKSTPIRIWHGAADAQVTPDGSRAAARWLKERGFPHIYEEVPGQGHDMTAQCLGEIPEWFLKQRLAVR